MCIPRDTLHRGPHTSRAITVRLFIFPEPNTLISACLKV